MPGPGTVSPISPAMRQVLNSPAFALLAGAAVLNLPALYWMFSPCMLARLAPAFGIAQIAGPYLL